MIRSAGSSLFFSPIFHPFDLVDNQMTRRFYLLNGIVSPYAEAEGTHSDFGRYTHSGKHMGKFHRSVMACGASGGHDAGQPIKNLTALDTRDRYIQRIGKPVFRMTV